MQRIFQSVYNCILGGLQSDVPSAVVFLVQCSVVMRFPIPSRFHIPPPYDSRFWVDGIYRTGVHTRLRVLGVLATSLQHEAKQLALESGESQNRRLGDRKREAATHNLEQIARIAKGFAPMLTEILEDTFGRTPEAHHIVLSASKPRGGCSERLPQSQEWDEIVANIQLFRATGESTVCHGLPT